MTQTKFMFIQKNNFLQQQTCQVVGVNAFSKENSPLIKKKKNLAPLRTKRRLIIDKKLSDITQLNESKCFEKSLNSSVTANRDTSYSKNMGLN